MRYTPHTDKDRQAMLASIGVKSIEELFADIPEEVRFKGRMNLPEAMSELELQKHMAALAQENAHAMSYVCFLGGGTYDHYIPAVVDHVISRSEFYTAYTPYQPEVSQAVLQTIYEYQTLICELTGMDVSNASMYDGASAVAEAAIMARATTNRNKVIIASTVHPEYRQTFKTYNTGLEMELVEVPYKNGITDPDDVKKLVDDRTACVIVQSPNFFGLIESPRSMVDAVHKVGAMLVVIADPISLGILEAPGKYGADIVMGEGQALGNPMSFGGPHLGFFATREKNARRIAGRVVGATVDNRGQRGFVLTLQTREQHIRREKATSNICSNEALNALAACVYLSTMGKQGIREVAELCMKKAHYAAKKIEATGKFKLAFDAPFFKEFTVKGDVCPDKVSAELAKHGILGGLNIGRWYPELKNHMSFAVTEKRSKEEIDDLAARLEGVQ